MMTQDRMNTLDSSDVFRVRASPKELTCALLSAKFTHLQIQRNVPPTDIQLRTEFTIDCFLEYKH
jgi:hypothetical protein